MSVLQHVDVVDSTPLHLPLDLAVLLDDGQLAVALQGNAVSGLGRASQESEERDSNQDEQGTFHGKLRVNHKWSTDCS